MFEEDQKLMWQDQVVQFIGIDDVDPNIAHVWIGEHVRSVQCSDLKTSPYFTYDKNFGDDRKCLCGHPYYRHFDTYEKMRHVGCKYCECHTWTDKESDLPMREYKVVKQSNVPPLGMPNRFRHFKDIVETPTGETIQARTYCMAYEKLLETHPNANAENLSITG